MLSLSRRPALFAFGAGALALVAAFVSQYGFGLHPCELCLAQRVPYAGILALSALVAWRPEWRWLAPAIALLFVTDAGIAFYHVGVEQGWIHGPTGCSADVAPAASLEALKVQILAHQIVACSDVAFRFLGLSMAGWNALYASASAGILWYLRRRGGSDVAAR